MCVRVVGGVGHKKQSFKASPLLPLPFVATQRHEPHNPTTVFSCCVAVGRG
jgi:hypothetical protein